MGSNSALPRRDLRCGLPPTGCFPRTPTYALWGRFAWRDSPARGGASRQCVPRQSRQSLGTRFVQPSDIAPAADGQATCQRRTAMCIRQFVSVFVVLTLGAWAAAAERPRLITPSAATESD